MGPGRADSIDLVVNGVEGTENRTAPSKGWLTGPESTLASSLLQ